MQWFQNVKGHRNWILASEHLVVRFFAIVFSVASAHAIWWFFSALNAVDIYQPYVTFLMTLGFAGMGFIISRGLAYRMLHKRSIRVHLLIAVAYEFVEVVCSLTMAVVSIQHITWLHFFHGSPWYLVLLWFYYLALPIIPFFCVALAWFDMGLDQEKHGGMGAPAQPKAAPMTPSRPMPPMPSPGASYPTPSAWNGTSSLASAPSASYAQGYPPRSVAPLGASALSVPPAQGGKPAGVPFAPVQVQTP